MNAPVRIRAAAAKAARSSPVCTSRAMRRSNGNIGWHGADQIGTAVFHQRPCPHAQLRYQLRRRLVHVGLLDRHECSACVQSRYEAFAEDGAHATSTRQLGPQIGRGVRFVGHRVIDLAPSWMARSRVGASMQEGDPRSTSSPAGPDRPFVQ